MVGSDIFIEYPYELLSYLREIRTPAFHNSNIFLRDLQYAIQDYFEDKQGVTIRNDRAESIALEVARSYEGSGIFKRVNPQGFVLNYPELLTPKEGGTIIGLTGLSPEATMPPKAKPVAAPVAAKPAVAVAAKAVAASPKPATATNAAAPAGAKAPPPWLKK